jgi:hypothetical protein
MRNRHAEYQYKHFIPLERTERERVLSSRKWCSFGFAVRAVKRTGKCRHQCRSQHKPFNHMQRACTYGILELEASLLGYTHLPHQS